MSSREFKILPSVVASAQAVLASSRRSLARHSHDQFGIGVVDRGGQRSHSGRGQVEAGPGDVITVNPGEVHDGSPVDDAGRAWRILYFDPALIARAAADVSGGDPASFEIHRPVLRDRRASRLVRRLFHVATHVPDPMRFEELLLASVSAVGFERRLGPLAAARPEVARARALIDADPAGAITLAHLSEISGLGRFQLLRAFAAEVGLTPHAYVVQRRLELARRLISGGAHLADAAFDSGFSDQSHMTRAFTRRYGFTPGAYSTAAAISFKTRAP